MSTRDPHQTARTRRRNFAIVAAGSLGTAMVLAVIMGPNSQAHPPAHSPRTALSAPAPDTAAAKLAAESAGPADAATDESGARVLNTQPSWNAPPAAVTYHGYTISVPSSWPVYNLATDPARCVLFNTHAVYLGTPGTAQHCPASAVGRTEALLIQPASAAGAPRAAVVVPAGSAALSPRAALPAAAAAAAAADHVIQVEVSGAGLLVTATFGTSEARLRTVLAGATLTGRRPSAGVRTGGGGAAVPPAAGTQTVTAARLTAVTVKNAAVSTAARAPAPPLTAVTGSGLGFDTCTVPSVSTMTAWLASPYRVVATYLGGLNWACGYGNFTRSWVQRVAAEGWRFMPLWVGRQAPCSTVPGLASIDPSPAVAEGQADARSAVAMAQAYGFGRGTPLYFDMEAYNSAGSSCSSAVLNFLSGWTRALHAAGYVSGVYSSANSGIRDLAGQYGKSAYPRPDDIWIANWNGTPVFSDPNVPNADWPAHERLHQYSGPHTEKWGGDALQIDTDAADGLAAGLRTAVVPPGPRESASPSELAVPPGAKASVQLTLRGIAGTQVSVRWQAAAPAGLTVTPSSGAIDLRPQSVYPVKLTLSPAASLAPGRYELPVTVTAGSVAVAKTFVLVSVVRAGATLPTSHPLVLYAADGTSMAVAAQAARALALPPGDVTGSFTTAWADVAGGRVLVLAVGLPAANALYFNVCGWTDPAGWPAGSTPFYYVGEPLQGPSQRNFFELADMSSAAGTALLTTQLTQYALSGTLPDWGSESAAPTPPALTCTGSPDVKVP